MNKRGRPKSEHPKGVIVSVRITEDTRKILDDMTERYHISKSSIFRKAVHRLHEQEDNEVLSVEF